ncbi:Rid family hydrolase [Oceanicella sp. SM1341]|uniref:Rid family hydrolase n=1 Tax=Oceanicella sp. SM1341 TaxID=1548889 RepID=UPI000E4E7750|nr:Rid family hydrolase [Oceanicella sp. SM1341]
MTAPASHADRDLAYFGVPWEEAYGYAQAVRKGNMLFISGQLSHAEDGTFIAPAELDEAGRIVDASNTGEQMRATYVNAQRILAKFGATLADVVEETIYAIDMDAAFAAAGPVRKAAYGTERPAVASTIAGTTRLVIPHQLIEISMLAIVAD